MSRVVFCFFFPTTALLVPPWMLSHDEECKGHTGIWWVVLSILMLYWGIVCWLNISWFCIWTFSLLVSLFFFFGKSLVSVSWSVYILHYTEIIQIGTARKVHRWSPIFWATWLTYDQVTPSHKPIPPSPHVSDSCFILSQNLFRRTVNMLTKFTGKLSARKPTFQGSKKS